MKVVCIDNKRKVGSVIMEVDLESPKSDLPLTIGKVYETSGGPTMRNPPVWIGANAPTQYSIICDDGIIRDFSTTRFISVDAWRQKQLDKLL
jgi:hypothetical protein